MKRISHLLNADSVDGISRCINELSSVSVSYPMRSLDDPIHVLFPANVTKFGRGSPAQSCTLSSHCIL